MSSESQLKRTSWYLNAVCLGIGMIQIGCGGAIGPPVALRQTLNCSPADAKAQLRKYFSSHGKRTSESAPDDRTFVITTEPIEEVENGKIIRRATYAVQISPGEAAETTSLTLRRETVRVRGIRERNFHDEENILDVELVYEKQLWTDIQNICSGGQH